MTKTVCADRSQWEQLVAERYPTARIEQRGKQYQYAIEARIPAGWDKGPVPSRDVGKFVPYIVSGGGLRLPTESGRGEGWVE